MRRAASGLRRTLFNPPSPAVRQSAASPAPGNRATTALFSPISIYLMPSHSFLSDEAVRFLQSLPPGLQESQRQALLRAMDGKPEALRAVRASRNAAPTLPDGVDTFTPAANLRLYLPKKPSDAPRPLLVYLHGGGWTFGSLNSCALFCAHAAIQAQAAVLAVDYRLAPEHPYPAALTDCMEALRLALRHSTRWGSHPSRVSIGGDSSGGNLALATAMEWQRTERQRLESLVLFYPVVEARSETSGSWQQFGRGYGLDAALMETFNAAYLARTPASDPAVSPALAAETELARLPRTLLVAADCDILRDSGRRFVEHLRRLGVPARHELLPGTVHLFITVPGQPQAFARAVAATARFLHAEAE